MITIEIYQSDNKIVGYQMKGHAGYAKSGKDIVCAAVSVLAINTANSLERLLNFALEETMNEGYLKVMLKASPTDQTELLLRSMIMGLEEIQKDNGKYLKVNFEEV